LTPGDRSDEEDGEASEEEDLAHFRLDNLPEDPFGKCCCLTLIEVGV
jgi:hypothetical protein